MKSHWRESLNAEIGHQGHGVDILETDRSYVSAPDGSNFELQHGDVVIAAITSCTNTSNPSVMMAAGLLARNAKLRGLKVKPWVKPSLAPEVELLLNIMTLPNFLMIFLRWASMLLDMVVLHVSEIQVLFDDHIESGIDEGDLIVGSVISGNRNFEGVFTRVKANYLASPLVVAYDLQER